MMSLLLVWTLSPQSSCSRVGPEPDVSVQILLSSSSLQVLIDSTHLDAKKVKFVGSPAGSSVQSVGL